MRLTSDSDRQSLPMPADKTSTAAHGNRHPHRSHRAGALHLRHRTKSEPTRRG